MTRVLNRRCRDYGCAAKLWATHDYDREQEIIQHGENPEHVMFLTLDVDDWSGAVETWIARIHADG